MAQTSILLRPYNGVSLGTKFPITAAQNYTAAVPEVLTLPITAGASASGNLSITLRGATPVLIAVLNTDTTAAGVATKVAAGTYPGWTAIVVSSTQVQFTATVAGAKTGANTFSAAATGVTASAFVVSTLGADQIGGDILFNFSKNGVGSFRYTLVAAVTVRASNGTIASVTGLTITYPANGQVRLQGQFATGQIVDLIASPTEDSPFTYSP